MDDTPFEVARRWFEEVWNQRKVETIYELLGPDSIGHLATGDVKGPAAFRQFHSEILAAFPDQKMTLQRVIADDNEAVVHWQMEGTHEGPAFGVAASGKKVTFSGMTRFAIKDGVIVEGWDCWDSGGVRESLMK